METDIDQTQTLIDQLDCSMITWRQLSKADRRSVISTLLEELRARCPDTLSHRQFQTMTPNWLPARSASICQPFDTDWAGLVRMHDLDPHPNHHRYGTAPLCDCGRGNIATIQVKITMLSPSMNEIYGRLLLCETCYTEHLELEKDRQ